MFLAMLRSLRQEVARPAVFQTGLFWTSLEDRTVPSTVYGLTANNTLLRFVSASPATIQRTINITGLQLGSERVIGIDIRRAPVS